MAIQKSITDDFGSTHAQSYTKISRLVLNEAEIELFIKIYTSAVARSKDVEADRKSPFSAAAVRITGDDLATYFADSVLDDVDKSPLKQAYAWLKTQTNVLGQNWTTGTTDV